MVHIGLLALFLLLPGALFAQDAGMPADAPPAMREAEVKTEVVGERLSMRELILKGKYFMIPLALASIIALTLAFERAISLRRRSIVPAGFLKGLNEAIGPKADQRAAGLVWCDDHASPTGRIFHAGVQELPRGPTMVKEVLEDAGSREVHKLKRSLRSLSIIASVSPLIGLLGTVTGLITAFQDLGGQSSGKADSLGKGIYEALVTTAAGLFIAIPALLIFHWFNSVIDRRVDEIDQMGSDFIHHLREAKAQQESSEG